MVVQSITQMILNDKEKFYMERQKIITYLISPPMPKKQSFKILQAIDANGKKFSVHGTFMTYQK